jgi:hypothetical protein
MILVPVLGGLILLQRTTSSRFLKYQNKRTGQFWVFWKKSESKKHWFWIFYNPERSTGSFWFLWHLYQCWAGARARFLEFLASTGYMYLYLV